MHYTPDGREREDLTSVGVVTMPLEEVTHEVVTLAAVDQDFEIPPHAANHEVRAELKGFSKGSTLLTVSPHMHLRGKAFEVREARRRRFSSSLITISTGSTRMSFPNPCRSMASTLSRSSPASTTPPPIRPIPIPPRQ
jgi:hypothetical protein